MKKIKLIRTMIMTIEPDPRWYPEGATIEKMAQIESETDSKDQLFEEPDSDIITWEIVEE